MKKLIGSTTSPFVRRIRLMLADQDYDFECVNVFSQEGQETIAQYTTTGRIPLLVEGETVIWDSLLIAQYLSAEPMSLDVQKDLVLINEMTDAGVQLFQLRKFGTDINDEGIFSQNNVKRIAKILDYFEAKKELAWDVVGQWLFCTLDWYEFRDVHPWTEGHPKLVAFHAEYSSRQDVKATDPRE